MPSFAAGVVKFQRDVFPKKRELFERLSKGQAPEALFITCSDSRIATSMITQTDPGELFVCRNAGNIVPPYNKHTGGVTASIEYAVSVLKVRHIVICGHTQCGAMDGVISPDAVAHLPHVSEWLSYASDAVRRVDEKYPSLSGADRVLRITKENVMLQLENLALHPSVAAALAENKLALHGWVYDIAGGNVFTFEDGKGDFVPIEEKYAERFAKQGLMGAGCS